MTKRDTILIVDDMELNRVILRSLFEKEYNLLEAENGEQGLLLLEQCRSRIAVVLLDLMMPVMDGYSVMKELGRRGFLRDIPVIIITAEDSSDNEMRAFDLGASDIIMKPFEPHVVKRRVQNTVDLNLHKLNQQELIEEQSAKLRESNAVMVDALSSIIEYRSIETGQHIKRIRMFTKTLLEDVARCYPEFGLDDRKIGIIVSASSMHDIGKIAIPDSILNKPAKLTCEEFEIMKTHTVKGCEMLASLDRMSDKDYLEYAYNICRYHHERWNGKGYPDGLKGDSIPVCAQVVGIADCYDALTTDRVYKKAISPKQAFNMILNGECGIFSPKLLESFKNIQAEFASLSQQYADGSNNLKPVNLEPKTPVLTGNNDPLDTLQMGQMKYFTLLKYMNNTVMEVDFVTGLYHMVYMSSDDFQTLKSGNSLEESFRNFTETAVHPEDRDTVLEMLGSYSESFFNEGLMKRSRRYRIYNKTTRSYQWYMATMLRIDTGHPHERRAMIVWELVDKEKVRTVSPEVARKSDGVLHDLLGGSIQCKNDQWYTLVDFNEKYMQLLGYTKQEIREVFHNQLLNIIYPEDRIEVTRQTKDQLKYGNSVELEYRVATKDGHILWLLDKGRLISHANGDEYFYCVLIDITQSKQAQNEMRLMLERHKIIMEQTNDIIFEWNIEKDTLAYSSNMEKKFGYPAITEHASQRIPKVSHIHPENMADFERLFKLMAKGAAYETFEFQLADSVGDYHWCKLRAATQFSEAGNPLKVVGVITDIDEQKRL